MRRTGMISSLLLSAVFISGLMAGNPDEGGLPFVPPPMDVTQSPRQSAPQSDAPYPPQVSSEDEDEGVSTEVIVAIIGMVGTIAAAFVGAYFQRRKSKGS